MASISITFTADLADHTILGQAKFLMGLDPELTALSEKIGTPVVKLCGVKGRTPRKKHGGAPQSASPHSNVTAPDGKRNRQAA